MDTRKLLGPVYGPLSKARHSKEFRIAEALMMVPGQIIRKYANSPYFPVVIKGQMGMGALLTHAILICNYAEENQLIARVSSANLLYSPNQRHDLIATYFGPEGGNKGGAFAPLKYLNTWSLFHLNYKTHVSLSEASRLFHTYFSPKPWFGEKVRAIMAKVPGGKFDLSVHYRGTDKAREAPLVDFSTFRDEIARYKNNQGYLEHVFLATDEPAFEYYIRAEFPDVCFHTYNLGFFIDISRGRHFSRMNEEDKAKEAILNMLLLAEAPCLIRSSSNLSAISKFINPEIRTITLNNTHWGSISFPEKEIIDEETTARFQPRTQALKLPNAAGG
jgi:hypothetical protein